ncbi:hypothetical protein C8R42DRAFT_715436 [Lentinula raphanica]|nr:hypothetical protein C8R42DRAFT_715436 [Lentinula raphanica]
MPRPLAFVQRVEQDDEHNTPTHSQYNINYRQLAAQTSLAAPFYNQPVTTSSSYDYWWPYPPGGVATTTTSPTPIPVVSPTLATSFSVAIPSSLFSSASDVSSSSVIPTSSSSTLTSASSSISTLDPTTSALQSIILINATMSSQPAASSFTSYPKNPEPQNSNNSKTEAYLIPIFVVIGVVLGSVVAWIGWGCITRKPRLRDFDDEGNVLNKTGRRRQRRSELEVGPAYCSSLSERKDLLEAPDHSPEKNAYTQTTSFNWRALDADRGGGHELDPNFLAPPKPPPKNSRQKTAGRTRRDKALSRAVTTKTATSVSIYSQVGDEDETHDDDLVERMSFLDEFESNYDPRSPRFDQENAGSPSTARVVSLSRRRLNHNRNESDTNLDNTNTSFGNKQRVGNNLSRSTTMQTQSSTRTAQTGFRMVEGSPLPTPALSISGLSQMGTGFFWGNNEPESCVTPSKSRGRVNTRSSDSYTALPVRSSRSRSNSPKKQVTRQTTGQRHVSARDKAIEEYYGSSLPQSPPQIMCPKLESSLCFTPTLN